MKKLISSFMVLFVFLPLLIGIIPAQAADNVIAVQTIEEKSINAACKSGSHKISFTYQGVEKAWVKLSMDTACWSACGVSLKNSTRSKWAASGWAVTWNNSSLGGRSCGFDSFKRFTDATVNAPPGLQDYISHQEAWFKFQEPLDFNWSSSKTPVIIK